jgi:hypothetical protein
LSIVKNRLVKNMLSVKPRFFILNQGILTEGEG